jgi:hypothetical protein
MSVNSDQFLAKYCSRWSERALVRNKKPKPEFTRTNSEDFFPIGRQPLMSHPKVMDLSDEDHRTVLIQSCYKYMNDIAMTEMDPVIECAVRIANDGLSFRCPSLYQNIALTVVVDEGYHALVARDYMEAVEVATGIGPLPMPPGTDLRRAATEAKMFLPDRLHDGLDIIVVCIAENTLTREIVELLRASPDETPFGVVVREHLADEAQHCGYFLRLLRYYWSTLDDTDRDMLGERLVPFIRTYLSTRTEEAFARQILQRLGFSPDAEADIITGVYGSYELGAWHPMLLSITDLLTGSGVLAWPSVRQRFKESAWAKD